jgi:hypothetical protein
MEGTPSPLAAVVDRIDRDQLAQTLLSAFRDEIPGYARLPESVLQGRILAVIRENLDLCLDWVAGAAEPDSTRFEDFRASARDRAKEGMPLEDLLHAYRMGGTAGWRAMVAAAEPEEREALSQAAELVMTYLDRASGIVASAYLEQREDHVSERERELRALFDALIGDEGLGSAEHETAARLRLPIGGSLAAFAAAIPGQGTGRHARAAADLRAAGALALTEGDRAVGLAQPSHDLADGMPAGALLVVDVATPRDELAASVADVRLGIEIALRAGRTGVVPLSDLAMDLLLARSPRVAAALRARVLAPLGSKLDRSRGDLLHTVATYVALGKDRRQTSERLHIHPNSLDYRLRRARELTGLNLDNPEDLATMVLALHGPR